MRKLLLTTASVLALGLATAGANAQGTAGTGTMPATPSSHPSMSTGPQTGNAMNSQNDTSTNPQGDTSTTASQMQPSTASKSEVRQAQQRLREEGLYRGRIDGVLGPETRQALAQFQQKNGLQASSTLDQDTMSKLLNNNANAGEGSSMPPATTPNGGMQNIAPGAANSNGSLGPYNHPGSNTGAGTLSK